MAKTQVPKTDIAALFSGLDVQLKEGTLKGNESPETEASRLRTEEADARHKRWRETGITAFVVIALTATLYGCGQIATNPKLSADDKKWATVVFGSIVTGSLAWLGGSKAAK